MKKVLLIGYIIILGFILSTVGTVNGSVAQSTMQNPGVFVGEVSSIAPSALDPATNYESQGNGFIRLMYEGLFQYGNNSDVQLQPDLATSYTISSNGLIYTFQIRTGVRFALQPGESVGQPFNAYVMQYSIDRAIIMNDHAGPTWEIDQWIKGAPTVLSTLDLNVSQAITFLNQQSVKAIDATTLQITLSAPFGGFIQTLMYPDAFAISPKAIIDNEPSTYTTSQDNTYGMVSLASFFPSLSNSAILSDLGLPSNYNIANSGVVPQSDSSGPAAYSWLIDHSAGTGPYYLVDLLQGIKVDFARNVYWWNVSHFNEYSVDSIKIVQVAEDATRVLDLQKGTTDTGNIPFSLLSQFGVTVNHTASTYSGVNSYVYNTLDNTFIAMNLNNSLDQGQAVESSSSTYMKSNTTPILKYSWNDVYGHQQYASPNNPFSALLFREAFANAFPYQTYIDQALAGFAIRMQGAIPKGLLGYDSNLISSGIIPSTDTSKAISLFNEVGWQGTITFTYTQGSTTQQIAAMLLQQAIQSLNVGIIITVASISSSSYTTQVFNGGRALFQLGWSPNYADPQDYVVPYYLAGQTYSYPINYNNPNVNTLIYEAAASTSPVARTVIYNELEFNASSDYPYIYLDQKQSVLLARSWIQGISRPQTDSMNAITNTLSYQYLAKTTSTVNWSAPYTVTSYPTFNTSNSSIVPSSSTINTSPGFAIFSTLSFFITVVLFYSYRRKKERNN